MLSWIIYIWVIFLPSHQDYCMFSSGSPKNKLHLTGVFKITVLGGSNNTNCKVILRDSPLILVHCLGWSYCWWFRNPAPVEVGSLSYDSQGFMVYDFFHPLFKPLLGKGQVPNIGFIPEASSIASTKGAGCWVLDNGLDDSWWSGNPGSTVFYRGFPVFSYKSHGVSLSVCVCHAKII